MGFSSHFGEVVKACYSKSNAHPHCSQQGRPSYFQFMKSHFGILYRSEHHICAYNVSVSVLNCLLIPLEGSDIQKKDIKVLSILPFKLLSEAISFTIPLAFTIESPFPYIVHLMPFGRIANAIFHSWSILAFAGCSD